MEIWSKDSESMHQYKLRITHYNLNDQNSLTIKQNKFHRVQNDDKITLPLPPSHNYISDVTKQWTDWKFYSIPSSKRKVTVRNSYHCPKEEETE